MARKPFEDNPPGPKFPCGCPHDLARRSVIVEIDKRLMALKEARLKYFKQLTYAENAAGASAMMHLRSLRRWIEAEQGKEEAHRKPKLIGGTAPNELAP